MIEILKGDLMDIEVALQQALELARSSFIAEVKNINDDMFAQQRLTFDAITAEISTQFTQKLKEALN